MNPTERVHHLSKSRFVDGCQCRGLLWRKVHESDAPELTPDPVLQDRFDQGIQVGELARTRFPGGVLIDLPHSHVEERLQATRMAIDSGAPAVFEATFEADNVLVAVDVLERTGDGFNLIEVKASSSVKDEHIPDAAIQTHVLQRSGVAVDGSAIMHLNKDFRHPDKGDLFLVTDVSEQVRNFLANIEDEINDQLLLIDGALPDLPVGLHCFEPRDCPFQGRCWPDAPHHIRTLYRAGPKTSCSYMDEGIHSIRDLPAGAKLPAPARRQVQAIEHNALIVEPRLSEALQAFEEPLGYLDFETISRAIPVWPGLGPWDIAPVQFSYHQESSGGSFMHTPWLADGPDDPRTALAEKLVEACTPARRIVVYYIGFERRCLHNLQDAVPHLRRPLEEIEAKLVDLLPAVRDNVYHPDFQGSFSIKKVLTPLVPELDYGHLRIDHGELASVKIARLLLKGDEIQYCRLDTWAMIKLLQRLRRLA
jgi:predicted RecB family nuclease